MEIKQAEMAQLPLILPIYDTARLFMQNHGNPTQWANGYPWADMIEDDIRDHRFYLCMQEGMIAGVFTFFIGEEPTYLHMDEGAWLNEKPYGVIHRLASSGLVHGVGNRVVSWCFAQCGNLKADTHRDNTVMRHMLTNNGFVQTGIITVEDNTSRIAYQKIK